VGVPSLSKLHRQVAQNLRDRLARRGWEQYRLADHAGIGRSHLSRLLNLRQSPTLGTLEKLADALGVSVRELLPPS
jgi:transcriptional regulator with XRE-family HTH domain